jgi:flagella basal body P-ring formation protein FlgA
VIASLLLACCLAVPADITVDTETLTLGSIISFSSGDARASIGLGYAPQPGLARRFLKQEIVAKIVTAGLKTDDLEIPDSVLVHRKANILDAAQARAAIEQAFAVQYPNAAVNIVSVDVPSTQVPGGALEMTASVPKGAILSAPVFVKVDIRGSGFSRSLFVRTVVEVQQPQLVVKHPVSANTPISKDDFEWKVAPLRGVTAVASLEKLQGVVAARDLQPGQVLATDMLYSPLLVRKGESVTVNATSGGITIAATMRAKADARFGDTIPVEHLSGPGSASARVIGTRTLEALQK